MEPIRRAKVMQRNRRHCAFSLAMIQSMPIYQLLYVSEHDLAVSESGYSRAGYEIALQSSANNQREDITGFLLCTKRWFAQVLEGSRPAVDGLYERIKADPRHHSVSTLMVRRQAVRAFPNWSMGYQTADVGNRLTFLRHGISAQQRPVADQAEELVGLARAMVR